MVNCEILIDFCLFLSICGLLTTIFCLINCFSAKRTLKCDAIFLDVVCAVLFMMVIKMFDEHWNLHGDLYFCMMLLLSSIFGFFTSETRWLHPEDKSFNSK